MPERDCRRELAVTGWIVLFLSGILAFIYHRYYGLDYIRTFILILAGPFGGWLLAADMASVATLFGC
jgi:hypothetical protein